MRDFSKFPNLTHFSKIELSLVWSIHCNKTKSTLLELILKIPRIRRNMENPKLKFPLDTVFIGQC